MVLLEHFLYRGFTDPNTKEKESSLPMYLRLMGIWCAYQSQKLVSVEHRGIKMDQIFKFVVMHILYGEKHWQGDTLANLVNDHKFAKVSSAKVLCSILITLYNTGRLFGHEVTMHITFIDNSY